MNWFAFALMVSFAAIVGTVLVAWRRKAPSAAIATALPLLVVAGLNAAAPIRGFVDPNYVGYRFGMVEARIGFEVTIAAGSIFLLSLVAAYVAVSRPRGPALWFVALVSAGMGVNVGWPWLRRALSDPAANLMQFGEYLTIPGEVATGLMFTVIIAPLAFGAVWATRAARQPA